MPRPSSGTVLSYVSPAAVSIFWLFTFLLTHGLVSISNYPHLIARYCDFWHTFPRDLWCLISFHGFVTYRSSTTFWIQFKLYGKVPTSIWHKFYVQTELVNIFLEENIDSIIFNILFFTYLFFSRAFKHFHSISNLVFKNSFWLYLISLFSFNWIHLN